MKHLNDNIVKMASSDYFHMCGWQVTSDQKPWNNKKRPLFPGSNKKPYRSRSHIPRIAMDMELPDNPVFVTGVNKLNLPHGTAILDARLHRLSPTNPTLSANQSKVNSFKFKRRALGLGILLNMIIHLIEKGTYSMLGMTYKLCNTWTRCT